MNPNDGEGLATWEARRQRVKERTGNGNGFGTPLAIAIQLWPKAETLRTAGQLNPAWVEILQGLPVGWTDLDVPNASGRVHPICAGVSPVGIGAGEQSRVRTSSSPT